MQTNNARKWEYVSPVHKPEQEQQVRVKVHKRGWITKGEKVLYILVGLIMLVATYVIVSFASTTDSINREIQSLEQQISFQEIENETLSIKVEALSEPARITRIARENGFKISSDVKQAKGFNN